MGNCTELSADVLLSAGEDASLSDDEYGSDVAMSLNVHFGRSFGGLLSEGLPVLHSFLGTV